MARARARDMEIDESPRVFRKRKKPLVVSPFQSESELQPFKWGARKKKSRHGLVAMHDKPGYLKVPKDMQHRWSTERYSGAQESLIQILHEKEAAPGAPVQRQDLRKEARKYIGDTGLLDHLLKHMSEKVIATGVRFRRRHNPQGGMEYWLEDANLMEIRRAANITDEFWIPPPEWKPGDALPPTDAELIKSLREEVEQLKSELRLQLISREEPVLAISDVPDSENMPGKDIPCLMEAMNEQQSDEEDERPDNEVANRQEKPLDIESAVMERLERLEIEVCRRFQEDKTRQEMLALEKLTLETQFANLWKAVMTMQEKLSGIEASLQGHSDRPRAQLQQSSGLVHCSNDLTGQTRPGFKLCRPLGTFVMPGMASASSPAFRVEDILSPRSNSSDSSDVTTVTKVDETDHVFLTTAVHAFQENRSGHPDSWLGLRPSAAPLQA